MRIQNQKECSMEYLKLTACCPHNILIIQKKPIQNFTFETVGLTSDLQSLRGKFGWLPEM